MGTRSLTRIHEGANKYINMYRQFDGYPSGHGLDLFKFLDGMTVVNGFNDDTPKKAANGAGCLAAQMVGHFKQGIGEIYLKPVEMTDCCQDYEYVLDIKDSEITVTVLGYNETEFTGDVSAFGAWCAKPEEEEE